jgi:salicylate hydroxylase
MTPWQGSGAAMALEDAVILGRLFAQITAPDQVPSALQVYDEVRRPRTQRVAQSSRERGKILSGIEGSVGLDVGKMREALRERWGFIHGFDLEEQIEGAVRGLEGETGKM